MREEEEETTKEVKIEPTNARAYQLSLLAHMQPVAQEVKNGQVNGYKNGHLKIGHHQNGTENGHANKNGHAQKKSADQNRLIDPPQLEMGLLIPNQVRSNKGKSSKRRRKVYPGPSLFDWLKANQEK